MSNDRFDGVKGLAYYRVNRRTGNAYWCPARAMRRFGFQVTALGSDGPKARERARELNARWQAVRGESDRNDFQNLVNRKSGREFVYFLRIEQRIKIGTSIKPLARMQSIIAAASAPMTQLVVVRGTPRDERWLHRRFKDYRTNGEWFAAKEELLRAIGRIAATGNVRACADEGTKVEPHSPFLMNRELNRTPSDGGLNA